MKQRLESLDITRGLTVAGMILVNNGMSDSWPPLRHAVWNGLTLADLVFPFFLFIMGFSMFLSLSARHFEANSATISKILKRTLLLLLLGLAINWLDKAAGGKPWCWGELRFWAVLQRIAFCYLLVALWALTSLRHHAVTTMVIVLAVYTVLLVVGNGYDYDSSTNILARIDRAIVGEAHLYHKSPVDPEGLPGILGSLVNVLAGFYCASLIRKNIDSRIIALYTAAAIILAIGGLLTYCLPVNKRIWSPSFALVTSGMCALLLAVIMTVTDRNKSLQLTLSKPIVLLSEIFKVFGTNALALYIISELLAIFFGATSISKSFYSLLLGLIPFPMLVSLTYALLFVTLNFLIGLILYRRHIFIKL